MIIEGNYETANGWPLGLLVNINSSIREVDAAQVVAPPQTYVGRILHSSSFSSFTSSNLDTQSTTSFFPDRNVSLGRLIGIRPTNKGSVYSDDQHWRMPGVELSDAEVPKHHKNYEGLCAPLLHHVIGRMGRGGSKSRDY